MATFNAGAIEATLTLDRSPFQQGIDLARRQARRFAAEKFQIKLDADESAIAEKIRALEARLEALNRTTVSADVDADTTGAEAHLEEVEATLEDIDHTSVSADVDVDIAGAQAHIAELEARLAVLEHTRTTHTVDVEVNTSGGGLGGLLSSVGGVASGFGTMTGLITMAGSAAMPVIAGLTAAAGGLTASLGAAGGGLGLVAAGVMGQVKSMAQAKKAMDTLEKKLGTLDKGSQEYKDTLATLTQQQKLFTETFGPAAVGMDRLANAWGGFMQGTEHSSLALIGNALTTVSDALPTMIRPANLASAAVNGLLTRLDDWGKGGGFKGIADFLSEWGPNAITRFGEIIGNLGATLGHVIKAFAPFGSQMLDWLERVTAGWASASDGMGKKTGFQKFMAYVSDTGPLVLHVLGSLWDALLNIGQALAPAAVPILTAVAGGLDMIAGIDPKRLGEIGGSLEIIIGALMLAAGDPMGLIPLLAGALLLFTNLDKEGGSLHGRLQGIVDVGKQLWHWLGVKWDDLWKTTMKPGLQDIAKTIRDDFLPAWDQFWPIIRPIMKLLGEGMFQQAKGGMHDVLKLIRGSLKILSGILDTFTGLATGNWKLWFRGQKKIASGALDGIETLFHHTFIGRLVTMIGNSVTAMGRKWGGIKGMFAGPINWVIDNVLNRFVSGVNGIAKTLGHAAILTPLHHVVQSAAPHSLGGSGASAAQHAKNVGRFAAGGVLPGFTPGVDVHHYKSPTGGDLHLSGGEAVMVPEWTRAVGGPAAVKRMNAEARYGAKAGQAFARGGVVWPTTGRRISTYRNHDGVDINGAGQDYGNPIYAFRPGRISYAGWGHGYGHAIFEKVDGGPTVVYGHGSAVYVRSGQRVTGGQMIGRVGSTGNSTGPHLHFGIPGGTYSQALSLLHGALFQGGGGALGGGGFSLPTVGELTSGLLSKLTGSARNAPGGKFGRSLATGALSKLTPPLLKWTAKRIAAMTPLGGALGALGHFSGPVMAVLKGMSKAAGWGSQWGALASIIGAESGGNPRAENPTSTASGLFQMIDGTARAYGLGGHAANASVPRQIAAGLRYISSRYGSPSRAWAFHRAHGWYDQGGIANGIGYMPKNTPLPERVLSPRQTVNHERLTDVLGQLDRDGVLHGTRPARPAGSLDGWTRTDIERLIAATAAANPVVVPESDKVKELMDSIGFELRVQGR